MENVADKPHSYQYLIDDRLSWWSQKYVRLLLERADATQARAIADIGIGQGHWSDLVLRSLDSTTVLYGIDQEACWLDDARQRFLRHPKAEAFKPIHADAANIPIESDAIDMATCQTLLMHCHDPEAVVREMLRIVRPGGALLVVEPVNILNRAQVFELSGLGISEDHIDLIRFWSHYHAYLRRERRVDHDIGARLPDLFASAGAKNIALFQNDTILTCPVGDRPARDDYEYASPEVKAAFAENEYEQTLYTRGLAAFEKLDLQFGAMSKTYAVRQNLVVMVALK
jgi:ubiquinone/menaquinone biosynthesis C-methylase UbiE